MIKLCEKKRIPKAFPRVLPNDPTRIVCSISELVSSSNAYCFALALMAFSDILPRLICIQSVHLLFEAISLAGDAGLLLLIIRIIVVVRPERRSVIFFSILLAVFGMGYISTGNSALVKALILLVASSDVELWKVTRTCRIAFCLGLTIGVISWMVGVFAGQPLDGFAGFDHKNQFALALFVIVALWFVERMTYRKEILAVEWGAVSAVILATALIVQSKTAAACMALLAVLCLALRTEAFEVILRSTAGQLLAKAFQGICLIFSVGTAVALPAQPVVQALDKIMTNRIWLNWYALQNHTLSLFGNNVNLNEGTGTAFNFVLQTGNNAVTVDNTYILSLFILGVLPTIAFAVLFAWVMSQFFKDERYVVICTALVLCLYGLMEAQMVDIFNNFIIILPLTTVHIPAHFKERRTKLRERSCTHE